MPQVNNNKFIPLFSLQDVWFELPSISESAQRMLVFHEAANTERPADRKDAVTDARRSCSDGNLATAQVRQPIRNL